MKYISFYKSFEFSIFVYDPYSCTAYVYTVSTKIRYTQWQLHKQQEHTLVSIESDSKSFRTSMKQQHKFQNNYIFNWFSVHFQLWLEVRKIMRFSTIQHQIFNYKFLNSKIALFSTGHHFILNYILIYFQLLVIWFSTEFC